MNNPIKLFLLPHQHFILVLQVRNLPTFLLQMNILRVQLIKKLLQPNIFISYHLILVIELLDCHFQHLALVVVLVLCQLNLKFLVLNRQRVVLVLEMLELLFDLGLHVVGT